MMKLIDRTDFGLSPEVSFEEYERDSPIVVGGSSGSGTRVIVWLLHSLGVYMFPVEYSVEINPSVDCLPMAYVIDRYFPPEKLDIFYSLPEKNMVDYDNFLKRKIKPALNMHLVMMHDEKMWGWKNPRNKDMLPIFHKFLFRNMKFIHVVRDCRDISPEWMIQDVSDYYKNWLLKSYEDSDKRTPLVNYFRIWDYWNSLCADYGEKYMKGNYLRMKLEDMCRDDGRYARKELRKFLGVKMKKLKKIPKIEMPKSIGRYVDNLDKSDNMLCASIAGETMRRFGYEI